LLPRIHDHDFNFASHLIKNDLTDNYATRLTEGFKAGRDVNRIAVDVIAVAYDVPNVDADAEFDSLLLRRLGVTLGHAALDIDGAPNCSDNARELDQGSVTG
jgi:hypothetical protein